MPATTPVWDRDGVVYNVTEQPFFYETLLFRLTALGVAVLLVAGAYRQRIRQISANLDRLYVERLSERERIARELHDTLLQSFHSLMFRFQAARNMLPGAPRRQFELWTEPSNGRSRQSPEGERQVLSPILQDEIYRIAPEVLRNAFQHARARQIEAEVRYNHRLLRLRIRDDGKGIDPKSPAGRSARRTLGVARDARTCAADRRTIRFLE